MNKKQAQKLMADRTKLVDRITKRLEGVVADQQSALLDFISEKFVDQLDVKDGKISNTARNRRLLAILDDVFVEFNNAGGAQIGTAIVQGVQDLMDFNDSYFSLLSNKTTLNPISLEVRDTMGKWLGIDGKKGEVKRNGYIDTLVKNTGVDLEVRDIAMKSVVNQEGLFSLRKALKGYMTEKGGGALSKYYRNFTADTYSTIDRTNNKIVADKLQLNYAIYEGGLIETSRKFCKERNGKVFTREEIAEFNPPEAKQPDYDPFTDLGGFGCRHHLNWIPETLALALRPDLRNEIA